jgi:hypothetical protein
MKIRILAPHLLTGPRPCLKRDVVIPIRRRVLIDRQNIATQKLINQSLIRNLAM